MRDTVKHFGMGGALSVLTVGAFWLLANAGVVGRDWWVLFAMIVLVLEATALLFLVGGSRGDRALSSMSDHHDVYVVSSARSVSAHSSPASHAGQTGQRERYRIRFLWAAIPPGFTALVLLFIV